jgi:hypothetical protein
VDGRGEVENAEREGGEIRHTVYPGQTWPMYSDPSGFVINTFLRYT